MRRFPYRRLIPPVLCFCVHIQTIKWQGTTTISRSRGIAFVGVKDMIVMDPNKEQRACHRGRWWPWPRPHDDGQENYQVSKRDVKLFSWPWKVNNPCCYVSVRLGYLTSSVDREVRFDFDMKPCASAWEEQRCQGKNMLRLNSSWRFCTDGHCTVFPNPCCPRIVLYTSRTDYRCHWRNMHKCDNVTFRSVSLGVNFAEMTQNPILDICQSLVRTSYIPFDAI